MSKNIKLNDTEYSGISTLELPTADGGTATFKDTEEIAAPSGSVTITENGTHDVTNYAQAIVNVPTSGASSEITKITGTITSSDTTQVITGVRTLEIPMNGTLYDNYVIKIVAVNTQAKENNEWIDKTGLDFSFCTEEKFPCLSGIGVYPNVNVGNFVNSVGEKAAAEINGCIARGATKAVITATEASDFVYSVSADKIVLKSNRPFVSDEYRIKYNYTVLAWNN